MNVSNGFNTFFINNICRVCLKTTNDLSEMSEEHINLYKAIVDEIAHEEYNMNTCTMCQWMFKKFTKFKHHCQAANNLLKEVLYMDPKSLLFLQNMNSHLTHTKLETYDYTPFTHLNDEFTHDTQNYTHHIESNTDMPSNRLDYDTYDNQDTPNDTQNYVHDDTHDNVFLNEDEDEIPLVLLHKREKTKKRRKKKIENVRHKQGDNVTIKEELDIMLEVELVENKEVKKKRTKKEPRDGFSSRMVQETDEYLVIKLTKEQVLKEMGDRSRTDSYQKSPFRCEKCIKGFNFEDVLQAHMEKHSVKNGAFLCEMCGQYCASAVSLRGHVKSHTTRYKCKLCGHTRVSRQHLLEHHAITHTSAATAYNCDYCKFTTNKRTVMQRHVRRHVGGEPHACDKCGKLFKSIESLRLHTARHDKSPRHRCPHCTAVFVYHSLLRRHVVCVHERRDYYCVECDVQFKCAESLRLHFKKAKKHRDSSAFKHACAHCPSRFFSAASLSVHLSSAHNEPKAHPCPHCRRLYSSRDAVRAHAWRVHSRGDARASCPHCGEHFARKSTLKLHIRTHAAADLTDKLKNDELPQYENKIEV